LRAGDDRAAGDRAAGDCARLAVAVWRLRATRGPPYKRRAILHPRGGAYFMSVDYAAQRAIMVDSQVRPADVTDYAIQDAMRAVARETLLPPERAGLAYADVELAYAPGRWLLKPRDIGKLLQALRPRAGERALAIAAPYAAEVLEAMGLQVDRVDGEDLTQPTGAYDLVVCEGAVAQVPEGWLAVLARPGARLGVVELAGPVGRAVLYLKTENGVGRRDLFDCGPPVMAGFEPRRAFTF
jgi:protein-L-isoaspartate(D-aspartate) O-methyltransferase